MEASALWRILKFGKIFAIFPYTTAKVAQPNTVTVLKFRFFSAPALIALFIGLGTLIGSGDLSANMVFPVHQSSDTLAIRALLSGYTSVYMFTFWIRMVALNCFPKIIRIVNVVQRERFFNDRWCNRGQLMCKKYILLAYSMGLVQFLNIFQLTIQDWNTYSNTVEHVTVIPCIKGIVLLTASLCNLLNHTSVIFGGIFPLVLILNLACCSNARIIELDKLFSENMASSSYSRQVLIRNIRSLFVLRGCFEDLRDINEGLLLPMILVEGVRAFSFFYCAVFEVGSYPRIIEAFRLMPPLGLMMLTIYVGSFISDQVNRWRESLRHTSVHFKDVNSELWKSLTIRKLAGGLSEWDYQQSAGGVFCVNTTLLGGITQAFLVCFIFLAQVKTAII